MNFNEFVAYVKNNVTDMIPEQYKESEIEIQTVTKFDSNYTGLVFVDEGLSFSLDALYKHYKAGVPLAYIFSKISEVLKNGGLPVSKYDLLDYNQAKKTLFITVKKKVDAENLFQIQNYVYTEMDDLVIMYRLIINGCDNVIKKPLLEKWGISKEQLQHDALENTISNPYPATRVFEEFTDKVLFEEFTDMVKIILPSYMPEEYQNAELEKVVIEKANGSYTGYVFKKTGITISPIFHLNNAYERFKNGVSLDEMFKAFVSDVVQIKIQAKLQDFLEYNIVKQKLFAKVISVSNNEKYLTKIPHKEIEDIAIIYYIKSEDESDSTEYSAVVKNFMLESWGISEEQLHHDAMLNTMTKMPAFVGKLDDCVQNLLDENDITEEEACEINEMIRNANGNDVDMLIVTNNEHKNGAITLFYPEVMRIISDIVGGSYYVIPSSIHEFLVFPAKYHADTEDLKEMINAVNTSLDKSEILSNHAYFYNATKDIFCSLK